MPGKGKVLTQISLFWFDKLKHVIPTHFVTANVDEMPEEVRQYKDQLEGRTMLVKKAKVIPLEAIVRGYITGAHDHNIRSFDVYLTLLQVPAGRNIRSLGPSTKSLCRQG